MESQRLSDLPDELILKIFSFLPMFKETLATNLISRRWSEEDPWKLVSDVTLDNDDDSFMRFIYGSLLSNDAQTLERLHLKLVRRKSASNIDFVVQVAVNRSVRKLRIDLSGRALVLPRCLSTCKTLKSLILREVSIVVYPDGLCLPSLKTLHLFSVNFSGFETVASILQICPDLEYLVLKQTKYHDVPIVGARSLLPSLKSLHLLSVKFSSDESVASLLRKCEALEDLVINRTEYDNVKLFNINVPTLRSLSINNSRRKQVYIGEDYGFVVNAPVLEKLNIKDTCSNFLRFEYMPEVTKANIEVICHENKFIGSLTSIQDLSFCALTSTTPYPRGTFFFFFEHLELCTCSEGWANLLACILNDAPRLQSLKLDSKHSGRHYDDPIMNHWIEPKVVPECLSKHLEILEWRPYEGRKQERKVAAYILANATCLKTGTFLISSRCKSKYVSELKTMSRVSETYQLVFK
ncbi:hypothetical protein EUTSA_v10016046mg [Eutrema salsugineum]|uniref:F-box domain-containing protein n=1 Tax=Eutrema salsugineum TaxID=72664 RepID=V4KZ69_EUTSA|nr:putative FBD-associated F-box protein At5g56560 [Eutrema salsugineum]ESQ43285.1 hypothetical protein EUTSA_v10016046mg [Eutrema salsugineum]